MPLWRLNVKHILMNLSHKELDCEELGGQRYGGLSTMSAATALVKSYCFVGDLKLQITRFLWVGEGPSLERAFWGQGISNTGMKGVLE